MRADAARARAPSGPAPERAARDDAVSRRGLSLDFSADPMAVRHALECVVEALAAEGVGPEDRALAEILLAEVLNNVVEHAYGRRGGWIEVEFSMGADGGAGAADRDLAFVVHDWGRALPGGLLPDGRLPPLAPGALPEGGFGWHLIRALASGLDHGRQGGRNWLRFSLSREQRSVLG